MLHLISHSHPFFTKEGSVTLLLTISRSSAISLRPITAQSDVLHASPTGACLHESHWAKLLTLQRLLHSSACQARQWAQRGGGIPRGISWNAIRSGWGRRHLLVWEKRLQWQVDGKAARLACVGSWGWVGQPCKIPEDGLPGSTVSVLPIPCNHHSDKGGIVPRSLLALFLKKKK